MNTTAIIALILSIFNTFFIIGLVYYWNNNECEQCKEKLTAKEILRNLFTLSNKCKTCRGDKGDKESKKGYSSFFSRNK